MAADAVHRFLNFFSSKAALVLNIEVFFIPRVLISYSAYSFHVSDQGCTDFMAAKPSLNLI